MPMSPVWRPPSVARGNYLSCYGRVPLEPHLYRCMGSLGLSWLDLSSNHFWAGRTLRHNSWALPLQQKGSS